MLLLKTTLLTVEIELILLVFENWNIIFFLQALNIFFINLLDDHDVTKSKFKVMDPK